MRIKVAEFSVCSENTLSFVNPVRKLQIPNSFTTREDRVWRRDGNKCLGEKNSRDPCSPLGKLANSAGCS